MKFKRIFLAVILAICCAGVRAQNTPQPKTIQIQEFEYKKPSVGKAALYVLSAVTNPEVIYTFDKSMVPQINEAVAASASGIPWLGVYDNNGGAPDYRLEGFITSAENGSGTKMKTCLMTVRATIVDVKTGSQLATKTCRGYFYSYYSGNAAELKTGAAYQLTQDVHKFIFEVIPVTGSVLEKGVEQANGKVKDNQCYVDLGSMHGVLPDMPLYIVENGKYKGELKVVEVLGDDLCSCKISKGKSYIEKNLKKGQKVEITSKPKKIKD